MGALELLSDDLVQTLVQTQRSTPAPKSDIRAIRPRATPDQAIANLAERQRALSERLASGAALQGAKLYDPSAQAALKTVGARLADLADVHELLDDVIASLWLTSAAPDVRSALVLYLEGAQAWALAATDELSTLATDLVAMRADWTKFRQRIALAKAEWPTELLAEVAQDLARLADPDVTTAIEDLSFSLHVLDANLDQRFG
jgi:hypothetical protein